MIERKSDVERMIEVRLDRRCGARAESSVECGGHGISYGRGRPLLSRALHDRNVKARGDPRAGAAQPAVAPAAGAERVGVRRKWHCQIAADRRV